MLKDKLWKTEDVEKHSHPVQPFTVTQNGGVLSGVSFRCGLLPVLLLHPQAKELMFLSNTEWLFFFFLDSIFSDCVGKPKHSGETHTDRRGGG